MTSSPAGTYSVMLPLAPGCTAEYSPHKAILVLLQSLADLMNTVVFWNINC